MTKAKAQLTADQAASAPANVIAADQAAITSAQQQLASTQQQATQSDAPGVAADRQRASCR